MNHKLKSQHGFFDFFSLIGVKTSCFQDQKKLMKKKLCFLQSEEACQEESSVRIIFLDKTLLDDYLKALLINLVVIKKKEIYRDALVN